MNNSMNHIVFALCFVCVYRTGTLAEDDDKMTAEKDARRPIHEEVERHDVFLQSDERT